MMSNKSEARIPNTETNPNDQIVGKAESASTGLVLNSSFEIVSDFGIRISGLI